MCMYVCKRGKIKQRSLSIIYIENHLCLRVYLIDVGCQTIRHVETDIDRSIDREKKVRDNDPDNYRDKETIIQINATWI